MTRRVQRLAATSAWPLAPGFMQRRARAVLGRGVLAAACALGCLEGVEVDDAETRGGSTPMAEFDPAARVIPLPNSLLIDASTGRVAVPPACGEEPGSAAERLRLALNQLDGFGTSRLSLVATFSEPVDPASLEGRVLLVRLAERGVPLAAPEPPVAIDVLVGETPRDAADCASRSSVPSVVIQPRGALRDASTYAVLIARGVRTEAGAEFEPSATWALVRQEQAPVVFPDPSPQALPSFNATPFDPAEPEQLARLRGLSQLWQGHAPLLAALDQLGPALLPGQYAGRGDALLAWAFRTQTIDDPFDASVAGSPARRIAESAAPLVVGAPAAGGDAPVTVEQFYGAAVPDVACTVLGCDAIGAIYAAGPASEAPTFTSSSFLSGDDCAQPAVAGGAFDDPLTPTWVCDRQVPLIGVVPAAPPGPGGYPTVIFAHGLGRVKEDLLALAGALARAGFASVAVDALDHGGRAVQISSDAALGCDAAGEGRPCTDVLAPSCAPQCYASLLSPDLAVTRDHLRQTAFDHLALGAALARCAEPGSCGALQVDPGQIVYVGQSLGALIGAVSAARIPEVSAAVLNVGGADWLQVLTETDSLAVRCPLIDALIGAGVLQGETWDGGANDAALCLGDTWKTEPGFVSFVTASRWLLDPVDGVNHYGALPEGERPPVLVAEVVDDAVVPNAATATLTGALGLTAAMAEPAASETLDPTPAVLAPGSAWVRYMNLDADLGTLFPGNAYAHGSLLAPAEPSGAMTPVSGLLGTLRMQVDTIGFLSTHLGGTP